MPRAISSARGSWTGKLESSNATSSVPVTSHEIDHLGYDAVGGERVEASLVEDLISAVITGIGAAHARGIRKFANAAEFFRRRRSW